MTDGPAYLRDLRALFDAVMDRPAAERDAYLAQATIGDTGLRDAVREMITSAEHADASPEPTSERLVGSRLGAYDIVRLIGRGGMGAVYEAIRADDQYRKRVAIKLVPGGLDSALTVARFRRERQILASLEHRNIATLLDGGVTPDGRPFLVMEYVEGEPLTTWCDARGLSVRDRIVLFRQVCAAVQYAHQSLIVHGDIKPGNILITADGTAKLLDFGIAKLLGTDDAMPLTHGGARPFTPEYASPEQIRGQPLTTASDVYSLGVVLFELCTGRRPHVSTIGTPVDVMRAVLHDPVPRPSAVVSADPRRRRRLRGELDNIILMALRSEPERRYASVAALAEDLRRQLNGLPVDAERDWAGYRLRKFVQRNRGMVAASILLLAALVGGAVTTAVQARRARAAQVRTERVNSFLRTLLSSVRPAMGGRDVPVSEVLDSAARRIETELGAQPDVRSDLETVIGESYLSLGRYDDAAREFRSALGEHRQIDGPRSIATVAALRHLGDAYVDANDFDRADTVIQQAIALRRSLSAKPDTLLALLLDASGSVAHGKGRIPEAEALHRQALAIFRQQLGDHADQVALTMGDVAVALGEQNRWVAAESLHRSALAILQANHPDPNTQVADAKDALATALDIQGKNVAAESAYLNVLALRRKLLGPEHPQYTWTVFNYAMFTLEQGRYQQAADLSRQVLALRGKTLPESHPSIATSLQTLGRCLDHLSDTTGGRKALEESLALRRRYLPADSWLVASSEGVLADHDVLVHQYAKAERLALAADTIFVSRLGLAHPRTQANVKRLAGLYQAWGRPTQATLQRARLAAPPS